MAAIGRITVRFPLAIAFRTSCQLIRSINTSSIYFSPIAFTSTHDSRMRGATVSPIIDDGSREVYGTTLEVPVWR